MKLSGDGLIAAVSSEDHDDEKGHVRVYEYDTSLERWKKKGSDIDGKYPDDNAGWGMALSNDGLTLAVGSYDNDEGNTNTTIEDDAGQTRVFRWDFEADDWKQIGQDILGKGNENQEGWKVDLSYDGNRLVTSGPFYKGNETDQVHAGRVRVFTYIENADLWEQLGQSLFGSEEDDEYGLDIAFSDEGNILAIGAGCYYYCDTANGYNHYVNVHKYNEDNNTWEPLGENIVPDSIYDQYYGFGSSVSLSGDGMTLAVGAVGYDTGLGNGFVTTYSYNDELEEWAALGQPLVISDGAESDYRIEVMALAKDASSIIVGSPWEEVFDMYEAGHAKVYKLGDDGIPAGCVDSKLDFEYEYNGQIKWRNCNFIAKRPRQRCRDNVIRKACPATCQMRYPGLCVRHACSDVGVLKYKTTETQTGFLKCSWVKKKPSKRCQLTGVRDLCRNTCVNEMCEVLGGYS